MKGLTLTLALLAPLCVSLPAQKKVNYHRDVSFAIDAIGKQCKTLLKVKKINWQKATTPLLKESKKCKGHDQRLLLLWRLLARLQDGHAALAAIGEVPGMILEFRGNSGGGFGHRAVFGRFLPKGVEWSVGSGYQGAGANPYGGPLIARAEVVLREFPQGSVRYNPAKHGWQPSK